MVVTKNDIRDFCIYATFVLVSTMFLTNTTSLNLEGYDKTFSYDESGVIDCETNSMGLTLRCGDSAYMKETNSFKRGGVYTYNYTVNETHNKTLIHRLVGCYTIEDYRIVDDLECSDYLVFMGDNNPYADRVQTVTSAEYHAVSYVRYGA